MTILLTPKNKKCKCNKVTMTIGAVYKRNVKKVLYFE